MREEVAPERCSSATTPRLAHRYKNGGATVLADATVMELKGTLAAVYPAGCLAARKVRKVRANGRMQVTKYFQVMYNAEGTKCAEGCAETVGRLCAKTR